MVGPNLWRMLLGSLIVVAAAAHPARPFWHTHRQHSRAPGRRASSTSDSQAHICSLNSLVGRAGQYAVQAQGFFEALEAELETLGGIVELHEQDFLKHGPLNQRDEALLRACSPNCSDEELFWKDAASKTTQQIEGHQTGYWDITDPSRPSDLYYPAWADHYTFDWEAAGSQELPPTPAALGLLKPRMSNNLTALCALEGLTQCKGNVTSSCPSYCVWPEMFNNSMIVYESLLSQNMIIPATKVLELHADSAFIWYWVGADSGAFRPVPPFNVMVGPGVTVGAAVGSDFVCPVTFCGPIMNPSKAIAWTPLMTDPYGNLLVTAARPVYIAGKWIGAVMTDVLLETTSKLVEQFQATQNSHAVLCDTSGAIVGASAETYSFLFCPEHPACNNGSTFSIGQSWDAASASAGSALGPQLVNTKIISDIAALISEIAQQSSGLKKTSGYYIVWSALQNANLVGGMRVVIIVPEADIDMAVDASANPLLIPLFKDQAEASISLTNNGALPWDWKASSLGDSVHFNPESGVLLSGEITAVALNRSLTNTSLEVTISATGMYATCFPPISVFLILNCENGEYRNGSFGSDSCKPCPVGHSCLANVLSPCSAGSVQPAMGQATCEACAVGRYQEQVGMTACHACQPGKTAEFSGADSCADCSAGRYTEFPGSTSCDQCAKGNYASERGLTQCTPCGGALTTESMASRNESNCVCPLGQYRSSSDRTQCLACVNGMRCPWGADAQSGSNIAPLLQAGFWSSKDEPLSVFRCRDEQRCVGGNPIDENVCSENMEESRACESCKSDYVWDGERCSECAGLEKSWFVFPLLPIFLTPAVIIALYKFFGDSVDRWGYWTNGIASIAFIVLNHYQVISILPNINMVPPDSFASVIGSFGWTADASEFFSISCAGFGDFKSSLILKSTAPAFLGFMYFLVWILSKLMGKVGFPAVEMENNRTLNGYFSIIFTFFSGICGAAFTLFRCAPNPNQEKTLTVDRSIICQSDEWNSMLVVAILAILLWVGGFGSLFLRALFMTPEQFADASVQMRWKFLFIKFRPDVHWWAIVIVSKGILLNLAFVAFESAMGQINFMLGVIVAYVCLVIAFLPWRHMSVNAVDFWAHICLLILGSVLMWFASADAKAHADESAQNDMETLGIVACFFVFPSIVPVAIHLWWSHNSQSVLQTRKEKAACIQKSFKFVGESDAAVFARALCEMGEWDRKYLMAAHNMVESALMDRNRSKYRYSAHTMTDLFAESKSFEKLEEDSLEDTMAGDSLKDTINGQLSEVTQEKSPPENTIPECGLKEALGSMDETVSRISGDSSLVIDIDNPTAKAPRRISYGGEFFV